MKCSDGLPVPPVCSPEFSVVPAVNRFVCSPMKYCTHKTVWIVQKILVGFVQNSRIFKPKRATIFRECALFQSSLQKVS